MLLDKIIELKTLDPDRRAIVNNGVPVTFDEFYTAIAKTAIKLKKAVKSETGGIALLAIKDLLECWVMTLALRHLGFDVIVVETPDVAKNLGLKKVKLVVADDARSADLPLYRSLFLGALFLVHRGPSERDGMDMPDAARLATIKAESCGGIFVYTSGTTGAYKKLRFAKDAAERDAMNHIRIRKLDRNTVYHNFYFPLYTGAGCKFPMAVWLAGGCVKFDTTNTGFGDLFTPDVNWTIAVPAMLEKMCDFVEANKIAPANFELSAGGGFVSPALAERAKRLISPNVMILFAASEASWITANPVRSAEDCIWLELEAGRQVKIVNDDDVEVGADEEGYLAIELLDTDSHEYDDDPDSTKNHFRNGYFYPGDLAVKRADRKIRVTGRIADVLNVNGFKISVGPIETQIQSYLKAANVCVFATHSEDGTHLAVVAVESATTPTANQIDAIRKALPAFDTVRVVAVEKFPRTATAMSKINRRELRNLVLS